MNIRKYLPFENYVLTTRLSAQEVTKRLTDNIDTRKGIHLSSLPSNLRKPYKGQIAGSTFKMSRIIHYKNSFLPQIKGQISTFLNDTQISIKMRPVTFVLIFMSLWLGIVALVCLSILLLALFKLSQILHNGFSPSFLIPFGMLIFGAVVPTYSFKSESKKAKEFLEQLLEGQENRN